MLQNILLSEPGERITGGPTRAKQLQILSALCGVPTNAARARSHVGTISTLCNPGGTPRVVPDIHCDLNAAKRGGHY
jgi:hypothetical protein